MSSEQIVNLTPSYENQECLAEDFSRLLEITHQVAVQIDDDRLVELLDMVAYYFHAEFRNS